MFTKTFATAAQVRAFLKPHGFNKLRVNYRDNPFGGAGRFIVTLTDIPAGVTLIHSSGSLVPTTTFSDDDATAQRIGRLRDVLKGSNTIVNH
jgi:hypothetical protein